MARGWQWAALAIGLGAGVACASWFGHTYLTTSPVVHQAASWLETRCAAGCMTNYLPAHVKAEAWVDLDRGAPLPVKIQTDESFITGKPTPEFIAACGFKDRVARARAAGYSGPILLLRSETTSAPSFSNEGFDPEHDHEGPVDLSHARFERDFVDGPDRIQVWSLPEGVSP